MRRTLPVLLAVLAVGCARGVAVESEAPAPLDPVGTYDFTASLGGDTRTGHFVIERTAAGYGGVARLDGEEEPAIIDEVQVGARQLTFDAHVETSAETFTFDLTFTGDAFTGNILAQMGTIAVSGRRRD